MVALIGVVDAYGTSSSCLYSSLGGCAIVEEEG
jgi:hypothetical protein